MRNTRTALLFFVFFAAFGVVSYGGEDNDESTTDTHSSQSVRDSK